MRNRPYSKLTSLYSSLATKPLKVCLQGLESVSDPEVTLALTPIINLLTLNQTMCV
jgi:hypothetical protein